jgi:hypothetical protein
MVRTAIAGTLIAMPLVFAPAAWGGPTGKTGSAALNQLGVPWVDNGQTKIVAQKTVVIPGSDGVCVLQLNADALNSLVAPGTRTYYDRDGRPIPAGFGGPGSGHLAMSGKHARVLATKIIGGMPRNQFGSKALVTGGTQTTSSILLPEIVVTGRPAASLLDVQPARIVPPIYSFLRQNTRSLAAQPVPPLGTKPTSDVGVVSVENRLRVVATVSSAIDLFLLGDNQNLMSFVTDELVYSIRVAVENEVISGDGTGEHFTGI